MLLSSTTTTSTRHPWTSSQMSASTRIAITGHKKSRNSHVGIHLWEAPSSSTTDHPHKKRKQVMIVHIDDHSIFASSGTPTKESKQLQPHHTSTPTTLKVGMRLISVNGITIRQQHSVQDIYKMLQNAMGYVTLLVGTPTITTAQPLPTICCEASASTCSWIQQRHNYDQLPNIESLTINDESESSSASSSFSSSSSSSLTPWYQPILNTAESTDSDDDDDDVASIIHNVAALESRIRNIWSPILTNGGR